MKRSLIFGFLFVILLNSFLLASAQEESIGQRSGEILEKEIQIPSSLEVAARIIFGIKPAQPVSFEEGIILFALWIFLLLIIYSVVGFIPFFKGGLIKWAASIVIMLLVSISGGFYQGSLLILGFVNLFALVSKNRMLGMFLAIVIIGILGWGLTKILGMIKREEEVTKAEQTGIKVGVGAAMGRKR